MKIKPGDKVLLPIAGSTTQDLVARVSAGMAAQFPGVEFVVVDNCSMTHALVYDGASAERERLVALTAETHMLGGKLETALDLLQHVVSQFMNLNNGQHQAHTPTARVDQWRQWITDTREQLSVRPK